MRYIIDLDRTPRFNAHVEDDRGQHVASLNDETIEELLDEGYIVSRYDYIHILQFIDARV